MDPDLSNTFGTTVDILAEVMLFLTHICDIFDEIQGHI